MPQPSTPFIRRPVATTLLTVGIALAGFFAFLRLPVSPLPQVDFPTISVQATLPGASPETVSTSVATPLERHLGAIADVDEMTSQSSVGSVRITLQFALNRRPEPVVPVAGAVRRPHRAREHPGRLRPPGRAGLGVEPGSSR